MNTSKFIKKYCKPTTKTVTEDYLNHMMSHIVDYETIREYLVAIDYQDYLKTLYWKAISKFVRSKFKECKCGNKEKLHVHHNTYKYIGIEHLHINCLEVLCESCHSLIPSCEGAPKSKDKGVGYVPDKDNEVKKYNSLKVKKKSKNKPSGKSQNKLLIELYVKHRMYKDLRVFSDNQKLPKEKQLTTKQKWVMINELLKY